MMIDRLVFGTARLVGGAEARASRALLERALAAGVRRVDTAPAYGLGTAEAVVGDVTAGRADIRIATKVGLLPPAHGMLLSYARRLKAVLRGRPATLAQEFGPAPAMESNPDGAFDAKALRASLERSLRRLRRDRVDLLLLHDPGRCDFGVPATGFLAGCEAEGRAGAVGYATGAALDPATDRAAPAGWTAQVAPPPGWIGGTAPARAPLIVHSLGKAWFFARRRDGALAAAMTRALAAAGLSGTTDPVSDELAALYMLAAAWLPGAGLVFATSDAGRLDAFFAALHRAQGNATPDGLASAFASTSSAR